MPPIPIVGQTSLNINCSSYKRLGNHPVELGWSTILLFGRMLRQLATDWSKMNLDLYNFHLRSPAPLANPQSSTSPPVTVSASRGYISQPPYCISRNNGQCRYCHVCSSCNSDHPRVSCPFHPPGVGHSRSPSPAKGGRY